MMSFMKKLMQFSFNLMLGAALLASPLQAQPIDPLESSFAQLRDQVLRDMQISLLKDLELKEPRTIAVLPFQPIGETSPALGQLLTDEISAQLFGQGFWKLIERSQLDKLMKEQGFSQTAYADSEQSLELGKLLGADAILIGSYAELDQHVRVSVRLIHVGQGTVLAAKNMLLERKIFGKLLP